MSNKVFIGIVVFMAVAVMGFVFTRGDSQLASERPGVEQQDKGQEHVDDNAVTYGGSEPPTSGAHSSPLPWQVYDREIPDINVIHNLEHGGIYISYRPDLPADQIEKIESLFSKPFSNHKFQPSKAIIAPRAANSAPIIMSSWNRNMKLDTFDEAKMTEYYLKNVGKSPEPLAS